MVGNRQAMIAYMIVNLRSFKNFCPASSEDWSRASQLPHSIALLKVMTHTVRLLQLYKYFYFCVQLHTKLNFRLCLYKIRILLNIIIIGQQLKVNSYNYTIENVQSHPIAADDTDCWWHCGKHTTITIRLRMTETHQSNNYHVLYCENIALSSFLLSWRVEREM